jgi:transcriptional regulator with XRE-family HTH domain
VREGPSFGEYLRELLTRARIAGRERTSFARKLGIDPSYLSRIQSGDRLPARHELVEAIATGLKLTAFERRRLLTLAGHAPIPDWTPSLEAVAERLARMEDRAAFEAIIVGIVEHWSEG